MTSRSVDRPIRVIQWTTGNIGRRSLHAIIGRDDMELVGVYAHGADKVGVDAAELSGWPEPTGITATNDILKKLSLVGKDLDRYSLETVEMFYKDAKAAGYAIAPRAAA